MELHFTGRGAMLNPSEGNTAAYFEDDQNLFLIDCGEDVAKKLIEMHKLDLDKNYYLFITHTHSDHIGSIGTLIQYLYYIKGRKLNIVFGSGMHYTKEIFNVLQALGITEETYNIINIRNLDNRSPLFNKCNYVESNHGATPLKSCSLTFDTPQGNILYTSDIADPRVITDFLASNFPDTIDKIFVDTSLTTNPVHMSLETLKRIIPIGLRHKVYCMHINHPDLITETKKWGFNLVDSCSLNLLSRDINTLSQEELRTLEDMLRTKLSEVESLKQRESPHTLQKQINHNNQKRTYNPQS